MTSSPLTELCASVSNSTHGRKLALHLYSLVNIPATTAGAAEVRVPTEALGGNGTVTGVVSGGEPESETEKQAAMTPKQSCSLPCNPLAKGRGLESRRVRGGARAPEQECLGLIPDSMLTSGK